MKIELPEVKLLRNNWRKVTDNELLIELDHLNQAIWLNKGGDVCYRLSPLGEITTLPIPKYKNVLQSFLGRKVDIFSKDGGKHGFGTTDLHLIIADVFDPNMNQEFFQKEGQGYRNIFYPTKFMQAEPRDLQASADSSTAIRTLLLHLVKGDDKRLEWLENWLAFFFQTLKKPQVALVLLGVQGAGKGILWNSIIAPLFNKDFCIQINDKSFKGNFIGGIIENKLFYNLDEISHDKTSNRDVKNQLKALVTNESGTFEKKHQTIVKETKIHGAVLITSNEHKALEIETSDRRFTVFTTGDNLVNSDYLGHGNYDVFNDAITRELMSYAQFLKGYPVNEKMANTPLDTREKQAIVMGTQDRFTLFTQAIKKKDLSYFDSIQTHPYLKGLYWDLQQGFESNRIEKAKLHQYYEALGEGSISTKALLKELRLRDSLLFDENNTIGHANGARFYKLDDPLLIEPTDKENKISIEGDQQ